MQRWLCLSVMVLSALSGVRPAKALDLVRGGKAAAVLVIPAKALPVVKFAAEELQYHVERATGARLAIVNEGKEPSQVAGVYLGACAATRQAGIHPEKLGPNGYAIRLASGRLYLAGDDSDGPVTGPLVANLTRVGTLLAVYEFLEKQLQVRWLWPGELGEVIPRRADVIVSEWDSTGRPAFVHTRWRDAGVYNSGAGGWSSDKARDRFLEEQSKWLRRHRFARGMNLDAAHAFTNWWERFHQSHPEYFNLLPDGQRRPDPYYHGGAPSLVSMCVSEAGFHRTIVEEWQRRRTPQKPFIDCSENDTNGKCTCPRCLAWDEPDPELGQRWGDRLNLARQAFERREQGADVSAGEEGWEKNLGSLSDRYARYFLAVQAEARKIDPDATVLAYAYANYVRPPRSTRLNDHVVIGVVPPMYFPWSDDKREANRRTWEGWAATGARLMLRPNWMLDGHNMPMIVAHKLGEDFRFFAQHGMIATDFDSLTGQFAAQGPNLYMLARLHDNPKLNVEAVLDEFYSAFGNAAGAVREYFTFWERVCNGVREAPKDLHWSYFYRGAEAVFTPETFAQARELLNRAQAGAAGDAVAMRRVGFVEKGLRNAELTLAAQRAFRRYAEMGEIAGLRAAVQTLDQFRHSAEPDLIANSGFLAWAEERTWNRRLLRVPETTQSAPPVAASENLVADGGFENGTGAWKQHAASGTFEFSVDATMAHWGKTSARICCLQPSGKTGAKGQASVWGRWYRTGVVVDPSRSYRLRVWARTASDFRGKLGIWVTGDAGGKTLVQELLNTEGRWREVVISGIRPKDGSLAIYLNLMDEPGTAWFDDVELVAEKRSER